MAPSADADADKAKTGDALGYFGGVNSEVMDVLKDLTAGTLGGCAGIAAGHPLDTVRVRLQTQVPLPCGSMPYLNTLDCTMKLVRLEGVFALFKGLVPPMLGNAPLNAVAFGAMGFMNRLQTQYFPENADIVNNNDDRPLAPNFNKLAVSGIFSGLFTCVVTTPVELVKCKLQVQAESSGAAAAK
jgi:solute carrier family 25 carnitine/acylcarnitine transporter 20/29